MWWVNGADQICHLRFALGTTPDPAVLLIHQHEMMHIFGIDHCVAYECIMKGTGHLVEDFSAPLQLCPVDLRKMQWRLGFSVPGRYRALSAFYKAQGPSFAASKAWVDNALRQLSGDGGGGDKGEAYQGKEIDECPVDLTGDREAGSSSSSSSSSSSTASSLAVSSAMTSPSGPKATEVVDLLGDSEDSDYVVDLAGEEDEEDERAGGTSEPLPLAERLKLKRKRGA